MTTVAILLCFTCFLMALVTHLSSVDLCYISTNSGVYYCFYMVYNQPEPSRLTVLLFKHFVGVSIARWIPCLMGSQHAVNFFLSLG